MALPLPWRILGAWFAAALVIFAVLGQGAIVLMGLIYCGGFGGLAYRFRGHVRPVAARLHLANFAGFALLTVSLTTMEELLCAGLGCHLAQPVLWVDLLWVSALWLSWATVWYIVLAPRYRYTAGEALLLAGVTGILFEIVIPGAFLANPIGALLLFPSAFLVYAVTFFPPLQLMPLGGSRGGARRLAAGALLPSLITLPLAYLLALLLVALGVPLAFP